MIDTLKNTGKDFIEWINPANADFDSIGNILSYVVKVGITVAIVLFIIVLLTQRKRIFRFTTSVIEELRKTDWLRGDKLRGLSMITIILITITTLIILGMDQGYLAVRNLIL